MDYQKPKNEVIRYRKIETEINWKRIEIRWRLQVKFTCRTNYLNFFFAIFFGIVSPFFRTKSKIEKRNVWFVDCSLLGPSVWFVQPNSILDIDLRSLVIILCKFFFLIEYYIAIGKELQKSTKKKIFKCDYWAFFITNESSIVFPLQSFCSLLFISEVKCFIALRIFFPERLMI